jgi:hypothetical protein
LTSEAVEVEEHAVHRVALTPRGLDDLRAEIAQATLGSPGPVRLSRTAAAAATSRACASSTSKPRATRVHDGGHARGGDQHGEGHGPRTRLGRDDGSATQGEPPAPPTTGRPRRIG